MPDSDSEDDFMSDKFLTAASNARASSSKATYTDRRKDAAKKAQLKQQLAQQKPLWQQEEEARRKGLGTSLFAGMSDGDIRTSDTPLPAGGKAMGMMMKMGWKVGEGLGRKNEVHEPEKVEPAGSPGKDAKPDDIDLEECSSSKGGIGLASRKRQRSTSPSNDLPPTSKPRTEPIRISLWSGKHGLGLRPRSPSPGPGSTLDPTSEGGMDFLEVNSGRRGKGGPDAATLKAREKAMNESADEFRRRRAQDGEQKRTEGREWAARKVLMEMDEGKGVFFHPLHVVPAHPAQTLPETLLRLMYPELLPSSSRGGNIAYDLDEDDVYGGNTDGQGSSELIIQDTAADKNKSAAQKLREQMRRDVLQGADGDEDVVTDQATRRSLKSGPGTHSDVEYPNLNSMNADIEDKMEGKHVDWPSMIKGVKKVMAMSPKAHLDFLVSSLREDHLYCFWCAAQFSSYEEMDEPSGCPGEDEADH